MRTPVGFVMRKVNDPYDAANNNHLVSPGSANPPDTARTLQKELMKASVVYISSIVNDNLRYRDDGWGLQNRAPLYFRSPVY